MKLFGTICLLLTFGAILNVESASLVNENEIGLTKLIKLDWLDELMKSLQDYADKSNAERGLISKPKEEPEIKGQIKSAELDLFVQLMKRLQDYTQETKDGQKSEKLPADEKPAQPEKAETKVVRPQPGTSYKCTGYTCPTEMAVGK